MSTDATIRSSSGSAARIADTLLRVVGGRQVQIRIYTQPANGPASEVGLPSPGYQDYALAPVIFRKLQPRTIAGSANRYELLVSATAVDDLLTVVGGSSPQAVFTSAIGIVLDGAVKPIETVATSEAFGAAYLFTLTLRDQ